MTEKATFGGGCFWGVEVAFRNIDGVKDAIPGYSGGSTEHPTYEQVCTGRTGHAESVDVTFDPAEVSYEQLLDAFWDLHDPTQLDRQGPDVGTQYRSVIFVRDDAQRAAAEASRERAQERFDRPVVTQVVDAGPFWPAEDYHQRYLEKRGLASCKV